MRRPWQIWLLYALGLAGVVGAFAWLSVKALELDRAESLARRQAELEEDISRALWRMDAILTPLLAEEAARPHDTYQAVYDRELSPLLTSPPDYVLLHFQIDSSGRMTSPECPADAERAWALEHGIAADAIDRAAARLNELQSAVSYPALLAELPAERPADRAVVHDNRDQQQAQIANSQAIANPYEGVVQQQLRNLNAPSQQSEEPPLGAIPGGFGSQSEANAPASVLQSGRVARPQTRAGNDLAKRDAALQSYAQKAYEDQRVNVKKAPTPTQIVEGMSRPLWSGDRLLVARRVQTGNQTLIEGCWLDWPRLKKRLWAEVADLLPHVELTAVPATGAIKLSRLLAALPVQLSVPPPALPPLGWTPIRVSLLIVWLCILVTAAAAALMLHSVVALSERRGAFVSAVTHELRTPLTTFRMYAEMLSAGMVPDASQRQRYLETLRIEADRLAHLVENVLQYARLERGRPGKRREAIALAALLERCQSRLDDRATQAAMKLNVQLADADRELQIATDPAALEQILFNLVDNACKYAAAATDRRIHVAMAADARHVQMIVRDHGPGISIAGRKKLFQPFSKSVHEAASTAPGVGLGLALSRRLAAELGGRLEYQSPPEGGAAFVLTLPR